MSFFLMEFIVSIHSNGIHPIFNEVPSVHSVDDGQGDEKSAAPGGYASQEHPTENLTETEDGRGGEKAGSRFTVVNNIDQYP